MGVKKVHCTNCGKIVGEVKDGELLIKSPLFFWRLPAQSGNVTCLRCGTTVQFLAVSDSLVPTAVQVV